MTKIKITAGLLDNHVEIFEHDGKLFAIHQGQTKAFFDLPMSIINIFWRELLKEDEVIEQLTLNGYASPIEKLQKYVMCKYGSLDNSADVTNAILTHEYYDCGQRGKCPMEGIVCKPIVFNGELLDHFELKMISLLATEDTLPVIAEKMGVCINTLDNKKKKVFQKFKVLSRAKLVAVAFFNNLIIKQYAN